MGSVTVPRSRPDAEAALLAITAVWGSTFIIIKGGLDGVSPLWFVALRFSIAAALIALLFRGRIRGRPGAGRWAIGAGLFLFLGYVLQTLGLQSTSASNSGFITGLAVVLVPFVVWGWLGVPPGRAVLVGAGCAAAGAGLISFQNGSTTFSLGDLLSVGCAVAFAFHIVVLGEASRRVETPALVFGQVALTGVFGSVIALMFDGPPAVQPGAWFSIAYTAVFATVLVLFVQSWAQQHVSASRAAIIFASEPVFAAVFATLGGEVMSGAGWVGAGLVVVGMVVALRAPTPRPSHAP